MKKLSIFLVLLLGFSPLYAQMESSSAPTADLSSKLAKLYAQYERCEVHGQVLRDGNKPVPGVKVKLYLYRDGSGNFGNVTTMPKFANTSTLAKITWADTDAEGNFKLTGVPYPASYFMEVTGVKGYKKGQVALRLDTGLGEVVTGRNIYLDKKRNAKVEKLIKKMNEASEKGKVDKAAELASTIVQQDSSVTDAYVILGNKAIKDKDYKAALSYFEKGIDNGLQNASILMTSARLAFQFKDLDKGIGFLSKVSDTGTEKDLDYYQMLSKAYLMKKDKDNAIVTISEMLEKYKEFKDRQNFVNMLENLKRIK